MTSLNVAGVSTSLLLLLPKNKVCPCLAGSPSRSGGLFFSKVRVISGLLPTRLGPGWRRGAAGCLEFHCVPAGLFKLPEGQPCARDPDYGLLHFDVCGGALNEGPTETASDALRSPVRTPSTGLVRIPTSVTLHMKAAFSRVLSVLHQDLHSVRAEVPCASVTAASRKMPSTGRVAHKPLLKRKGRSSAFCCYVERLRV